MLLRQTLLYLPAQLLGPLLQFVSAIVWTYFLSPEEMGVFALIVAAQELAAIGAVFWFTLYTMRHYDPSGDGASRHVFLNTETATLIGAGLFTAAVGLSLPLFITAAWSSELLVATIAYAVSRSIATHLTDRSRAEADTLTYTLQQVLWPTLGLVIGLACVTVFPPTAGSLLAGYAAGQILTLLVAGARMRFGSSPIDASRAIIRKALIFGLPLMIGSVFFWGATNGLRFVVEAKEGAAAVGLITVGWGLGLRAANVAAMLVTAAAFPLAVAKSRQDGIDGGQAQLVRNGVLLFAALAPASAGLWLISDPLVHLVVAEPFRETTAAALPFAILAGMARNMRVHFATQVFVLREQTVIALYTDAADAVFSVAGAYIGLMMGGVIGAVTGAALGAVASLVVDLIWGGLSHRYYFPMADFLKISAAAGVMGLAVASLPLHASAASIALAVMTGGAVYACALMLGYTEIRQIVTSLSRKIFRFEER